MDAPGVAKVPDTHPCIWLRFDKTRLGRMEEPDTGNIPPPKVNLRNFLSYRQNISVKVQYASFKSIVANQSSHWIWETRSICVNIL